MNLESCPSWPKEHDWKSCNRSKPVRGFESLALRQKIKSVAKAMLFIFLIYYKGFEQGGSKRSLRKKTVRWTVLADVVKERSDAKATAVAEKIPCSPPWKKHASACFFQWNSPSASEISFGYEIASLWNICFANVKGEFYFTSSEARYFIIHNSELFHILPWGKIFHNNMYCSFVQSQ